MSHLFLFSEFHVVHAPQVCLNCVMRNRISSPTIDLEITCLAGLLLTLPFL